MSSTRALFSITIGVIVILGGALGDLVLRGTNSGLALVVFGLLTIIATVLSLRPTQE